jgi:hypothetical protein
VVTARLNSDGVAVKTHHVLRRTVNICSAILSVDPGILRSMAINRKELDVILHLVYASGVDSEIDVEPSRAHFRVSVSRASCLSRINMREDSKTLVLTKDEVLD